MRIATYNINGVKARLPRLLEWLDETKPDIACLQEVKSQDDGFPVGEFERAGYGAIWHGQKSFNGVAILARNAQPVEAQRTLPGDPEDEHARYLEADVFGVRVASIYLPNGNPQPGPKFDYKLKWMQRLRARAAELMAAEIPAVLAGDYNVIPTPKDIWSASAMLDDALRQPESIAAYRTLLGRRLDRRAGNALSARRGVDLLGFSGRRMAARPWLPHRPSVAQPIAGRPAGCLRRRQRPSRPRKGQRPCANMDRTGGVKKLL